MAGDGFFYGFKILTDNIFCKLSIDFMMFSIDGSIQLILNVIKLQKNLKNIIADGPERSKLPK